MAARTILLVSLELESMDGLVALGDTLVRVGDQRELVLASSVTSTSRLPAASSRLKALRDDLLARGVEARAAAFTSLAPGVDFTRLATEQSADIVVVDAPTGYSRTQGF